MRLPKTSPVLSPVTVPVMAPKLDSGNPNRASEQSGPFFPYISISVSLATVYIFFFGKDNPCLKLSHELMTKTIANFNQKIRDRSL